MAFVIFSLPRSRSAWLAHFLSYSPAKPIGHDISIECDSPNDFLASFANGMYGTIETGAIVAWRLILQVLPELDVAVIRRPLGEVYDSLRAFGIEPKAGELEERSALLEALATAAPPRAEVINFADLQNRGCCRWLFERLLQEPWNQQWYDRLAGLNIQVDMTRRIRRLAERQSAIAGLLAEIAKESASCRITLN